VWGKCGAYRVFMANLEEQYHLEDLRAGGRVILIWVFKKWDEDIDWIDLAEDRDRWQTVVNAVIGFHETREISLGRPKSRWEGNINMGFQEVG